MTRKSTRFRLKFFATMVLVLFISLVLQGLAWFHSGSVFLGTFDDFGALFNSVILSLIWQALPIIVVMSALFSLRLGGLQRTVGRLSRGEKVEEAELKKAQRYLVGIPAGVFAVNFIGYGIGVVVQIIVDPAAYFSLVGIIELLFDLSGAGVFANLLVGIFNIWLAYPRTLLQVTRIEDIEGKKKKNRRAQMSFAFFLALFVILFSLTLGIKYSEVQDSYTHAVVRIAQGEDKATVSKEFFDEQRKTYPRAGLAQKDDILELKPDRITLGIYYVPAFLLILGMGAGIWWFSTRYQDDQLKQLLERMDEVVKGGNLEKKIEILSNDEFGELSDRINRLIGLQNERIGNLTETTGQVDEASRTLQSVSAQTARAGEKILASTSHIDGLAGQEFSEVRKVEERLESALSSFEKINRSVEDQARFVSDSSSAMTEMASSISAVTKTTQDARNLTDQLKRNADQGAKSLGDAVGAIREIEDASKEVSALTASIAKISAQTNLLAMNAAIEAAHAGDAGKGFAVVAQEVRNLALSSADSSKKIKDKIAHMLTLVHNGVHLSDEAGQSFADINGDIGRTASLVSEIASAMQEQNVGTRQILDSISSLVEASNTIKETGESQREQNARLKEAVSGVLESFRLIREAAGAASADANLIAESVAKLSELSHDNSVIVGKLGTLVTSMGGGNTIW